MAVHVSEDWHALVERHMDLVRKIAGAMIRSMPPHIRYDELVSAGNYSLVLAAINFDPARGVQFDAYAAKRIAGAIGDELRARDWVPRSVRSRQRQLESARQTLTAAKGGSATSTELAALLGMADAEFSRLTADIECAAVLSLHGFVEPIEERVPDSQCTPEELLVHRELIGRLYDAMRVLPARLRITLERFYIQELPMAVIAEELDVTESRVSQLRKEGVQLLKAALGDRRSSLNPSSIVERRLQGYVTAAIGSGSAKDLHRRLALTNVYGLPHGS